MTSTENMVQIFHISDGKTVEAWAATTDPVKTLEFWKD